MGTLTESNSEPEDMGKKAVLWLLGGAAGAAFLIGSHRRGPLDGLFSAAAMKWKVDVDLLRAIQRVENATGDPNAVNYNKAKDGRIISRDVGLMQINENTGKVYGVTFEQLKNPATSVDIAARLLDSFKKELGVKYSLIASISAYNIGGPRFLKDGPINRTYISSVLYHYTLFKLGRAVS